MAPGEPPGKTLDPENPSGQNGTGDRYPGQHNAGGDERGQKRRDRPDTRVRIGYPREARQLHRPGQLAGTVSQSLLIDEF